MKSFSIKEALGFGWSEFKKHPWRYIAISLIVLIIGSLSRSHNIVIAIIGSIIYAIVGIGWIKISIAAVDGKKPEVEDLFSHWRLFFKYLGVIILFVLMFLPVAIIGFIIFLSTVFSDGSLLPLTLFAVASIIYVLMIVTRYCFTSMLVIDGKAKIFESFKMSSKMTKGKRWKILGFFLACVAVFLLGIIALFVGVFISSVVVMLAKAHLYRKLLNDMPQSNASTVDATSSPTTQEATETTPAAETQTETSETVTQ